MTAEVSPLFPTGDRADETVRRTIDALIRGRDLTVEQTAKMAGIHRSTLYRRLGGKGSRQAFTAGEVSALARALRVTIQDLYGGLGGTFVPPPPDDGPPSPDTRPTVGSVVTMSRSVEILPTASVNTGTVPQVGEDKIPA